MPKDRHSRRISALAGLSMAMLLGSAGCTLLPSRKVPPEPTYSDPAQSPSPAGFSSQAPQAMGFGAGAPADTMPPMGSYGPGGMAGGMAAHNPALGMSGASDPSVNPALGMPGSMSGATAPAGYAPASATPSAGGASMPSTYGDSPSAYGSTGGYASPMLQNRTAPQAPYNMGTPGAPPAPL